MENVFCDFNFSIKYLIHQRSIKVFVLRYYQQKLTRLLLIKIYLSVDKPTQRRRFHIRKNHLLKYWKLSKNDLLSLSSWDTYTFFKNRMFVMSAKKKSPWIVINANNKMTARLNALRYVLDSMDYDGKKNLKDGSLLNMLETGLIQLLV